MVGYTRIGDSKYGASTFYRNTYFREHIDRETPAALTSFIGAATELGAPIIGCALAPDRVNKFLKGQNFPLQLSDVVHTRPDCTSNTLECVAEFSDALTYQVFTSLIRSKRFIVLGGDHSCALGTWSGAAKAIKSKGSLGLIWIDAHMDSHTPLTSPKGSIHGMPLAALLGFGPEALCHIAFDDKKLSPENICLIGVRSYEQEELALLNYCGIKVFFTDDIEKRGMRGILDEAITIVTRNSAGFGVSLDLDAIDPKFAPGVGSPVYDGLTVDQVALCLSRASTLPGFLGLEIAEYNPYLDCNERTLKVIIRLLKSVLGRTDESDYYV